MSTKAGQLLWNRMQIVLTAGNNPVNTSLTQLNKAWDNSSIGEPGFGTPSRVQVIPMSPIGSWVDVTHGEPYFDAATETVKVNFFNAGEGTTVINVLFWNPATSVGPGDADAYEID